MTGNCTIFSNSQMIVFEVTPSLSQLTLYWNGSDTAIQPSAAYTDTYFKNDNTGNNELTNNVMNLQFGVSPFIATTEQGDNVAVIGREIDVAELA